MISIQAVLKAGVPVCEACAPRGDHGACHLEIMTLGILRLFLYIAFTKTVSLNYIQITFIDDCLKAIDQGYQGL